MANPRPIPSKDNLVIIKSVFACLERRTVHFYLDPFDLAIAHSELSLSLDVGCFSGMVGRETKTEKNYKEFRILASSDALTLSPSLISLNDTDRLTAAAAAAKFRDRFSSMATNPVKNKVTHFNTIAVGDRHTLRMKNNIRRDFTSLVKCTACRPTKQRTDATYLPLIIHSHLLAK